jgi:hypothetical protein
VTPLTKKEVKKHGRGKGDGLRRQEETHYKKPFVELKTGQLCQYLEQFPCYKDLPV